ncbi:MAG: hypothetical protein IPM50_14105 [Acidobacteriota bacterium]|nr:MAG: hypothetical protein IPM50_14105 [Acidobacteriota bacterium]
MGGIIDGIVSGAAACVSRLKTRACCHSAQRPVYYLTLLRDPDVQTANGDGHFLPAAACRRGVLGRFRARFWQFRITFWRFLVLFCLLLRKSTFLAADSMH